MDNKSNKQAEVASSKLSFDSLSSSETDFVKPQDHQQDQRQLSASPPTSLLFDGEYIVDEARPEHPLYRLDWDVTRIPQSNRGSAKLERLSYKDTGAHATTDTLAPDSAEALHLFYLVHPLGAKFQTERPEYYVTCVPSSRTTSATATKPNALGSSDVTEPATLGNIALETTSTSSQRFKFLGLDKEVQRAWLSPGTDAASRPVFYTDAAEDDAAEGSTADTSRTLLFEATGGKKNTIWTTSIVHGGSGPKDPTDMIIIAKESTGPARPVSKGEAGRFLDKNKSSTACARLTISVPLEQSVQDALVATWVLRLWRDVAESPAAKKDALERMTDPDSLRSSMPFSKGAMRTGVLGAFAAAGGAG
ncbi:uncharacterized protein B0I36DRAFT_314294 [Microdochium trichocladiopsis]|uniref:Uncharacterized protein n=1 Tax=Microdochium trichocladiopsis TaxID=1682393 RepID=A0A9P8YBB2_9PEZI|nr:uncharacterized protein B0I36DRAFT_314294 [Microdochium trichocladiopsis]KAH7037546.1 hypothetical protein B0I36DRAFT_314294 [Microdochium trichocladiopsis]